MAKNLELADLASKSLPYLTSSLAAARLAIVAAGATLVLLLSLHILSPEFAPSWRMVSEYALGNYGWVLSVFFFCWAISSWSLAIALWPHARGGFAKAGLLLLVLSGLGEAMAAAFNVKHALHGVSALLGVPTLPAAAMILSVHLARKQPWAAERTKLLWAANAPWISLVLMAVAMMVMMSGFARAGITTSPVATVPHGVIALGGWANRLLIIVYCVWLIVAAKATIIGFKGRGT